MEEENGYLWYAEIPKKILENYGTYRRGEYTGNPRLPKDSKVVLLELEGDSIREIVEE